MSRNSIYYRLPARFRRDDGDGFLRRFLQFSENTLDTWDATIDGFAANIAPATASADWIEFWLASLFGWTWFPSWFGLAEKRRLYGNFARHLARRGTPRGIEGWLADFGIIARVHTRPATWSEFVWGESDFAVDCPLHFIIEILYFNAPQTDAAYWRDGVWEEFFYSESVPLYSDREVADLLNFVLPLSQSVAVCWTNSPQTDDSWENAVPAPQIYTTEVGEITPVSIELIWTGYGDRFDVERDGIIVKQSVIKKFIDTGLTAETPYQYRIRAVSGDEVSAWSPTIAVQTSAEPSPATMVADLLFWARIPTMNRPNGVHVRQLPTKTSSGVIFSGSAETSPTVLDNTLRFDGTKSLTASALRRTNTGLAAYFVLRIHSTISPHSYFLQFGNFLIQHRWDSQFYLNFPNQGHTDLVENVGVGKEKWIILAAFFDRAAQKLDQIYVSGSARLIVPTVSTNNAELPSDLSIQLGQNTDFSLAEIILDDKNHTPDERTAIVNHLREKYGLNG